MRTTFPAAIVAAAVDRACRGRSTGRNVQLPSSIPTGGAASTAATSAAQRLVGVLDVVLTGLLLGAVWVAITTTALRRRPVRPRPPVLLIPGLTMSGWYTEPTARALATDRRVVIPDLPGSGRSPHPPRPLTVAELADLLHDLATATTGPAVLVANSFGCQLAVEFALRHPSLVRRLVLTSPVVAPPYRDLPTVAGRFLAAVRHEPWPYLGIILLDNVRGRTRKGRAHLREMLAYHIEDRVRLLTVPTLVVRGVRDRLVPAPFAPRLASLVLDGSHLEVDGAHALPYDAPTAIARLVRDGDGAVHA